MAQPTNATFTIHTDGLNTAIKDFGRVQSVFHTRLAPKINFAVARKVKMYVGRRIDALPRIQPDRPGHNTPTPLKQFLRMAKLGGQNYEVRMDSGDGLDPRWIERGHAPGYGQKRRVKPTWFFRNGLNDFKVSGDFEQIIRKRVQEAFGTGADIGNVKALSGNRIFVSRNATVSSSAGQGQGSYEGTED